MANIKSAKKRIKISDKKTEQNKLIKSKVKASIKQVEALLKANDAEGAKKQLVKTQKLIDMATTKGVYHKNCGSRKVSRVTKLVNK